MKISQWSVESKSKLLRWALRLGVVSASLVSMATAGMRFAPWRSIASISSEEPTEVQTNKVYPKDYRSDIERLRRLENQALEKQRARQMRHVR